MLPACQFASHEAQKQQAEQDWHRLRARVKYQLAVQQWEQAQIDQAVHSVRETLQLDPNNAPAERLLARCFVEKGDLDAATAALDRAAAVGDASAEHAYLQGLVAERRNQLDAARRHYEQAVSLEPNNVDYLAAVAECLVSLDRLDEALQWVERQGQGGEAHPRLLLLRATILLLRHDYAGAAAQFQQVPEALNQDPWAAEQYALTLVRLGRHADALPLLQTLHKKLPERHTPPPPRAPRDLPEHADPDTWDAPGRIVHALADCYNKTGSPDLARNLLEQHLKKEPSDARAWWILAESAIRLADTRLAKLCAQEGAKRAPRLPHWGLVRAYLALQDDDLASAARHLQSLLAEHPEDVLAHCMLAQVYEQRKDPTQAQMHYRTALQLDPSCAWAQRRLRTAQVVDSKP